MELERKPGQCKTLVGRAILKLKEGRNQLTLQNQRLRVRGLTSPVVYLQKSEIIPFPSPPSPFWEGKALSLRE